MEVTSETLFQIIGEQHVSLLLLQQEAQALKAALEQSEGDVQDNT